MMKLTMVCLPYFFPSQSLLLGSSSIDSYCGRCSFWWPNTMVADEMTYVNLLPNPERYTGYIGPSARRIWDAIYSENCPKCKLHYCFYPNFFSLFSKWLLNSWISNPLLAFIWCVDASEHSCQEEKILYKLVSGLHSSISVHIASDYLLDEARNLVRFASGISLVRYVCFLAELEKSSNDLSIFFCVFSGVKT